MAGSLVVIPSKDIENSVTTIRDEWEINFARFFAYPSATSTCSDLVPLSLRLRNRHPRGSWISSSSIALLRLVNDHSNSDVIITICFNGKLLEEHYVSKLHFSWPQVSCASGFPARGIKTVLVSYADSMGEIQKFGLRFPSIYEAQSFVTTLKEILKDTKGPEPLNTDFGSEISSQSEFMSSNKHSQRACEELSIMTPIDTYIPQMPPSLKNEEERHSGSKEMETAAGQNLECVFPALPPSFTSLLMDCSEINQAQLTVSKEIDLKSQIVKYMEDSSFQDILAKVEKVICELGGDMTL
ncbi:protein POOR HOMOLOGOUS SYNAPSIS 1 [Senna tora]|uniref:Protein POOR HOMOLOGOUS SYNAPSIS 1 n=1 Tax=Senna tora TaxID=362788 RepID=A0A834WQ54_9FABA|nr:protein POOR HOMOLOGOUS SYNAPSIS 1 [Senna tora]